LINSELATYGERLDNLRKQVCDLLTGLPAEALNWRPLEDRGERLTNSLAALAVHIAGAEHFWIAEVIGGLPPTRDRDAEFAFQAQGDTELCRLLEQTGAETHSILSKLNHTDLDQTREVKGRTIPVRWGIVHIIDHTALHLGHMQLTYQLWMGGKSASAPLWHERLPAS